jgi:hypothetical protein
MSHTADFNVLFKYVNTNKNNNGTSNAIENSTLQGYINPIDNDGFDNLDLNSTHNVLDSLPLNYDDETRVACSYDGQYKTIVVKECYLYVSSDFGVSYEKKINKLKWRDIAVSSTGKFQSAVAYNNFIYVSSNFGITWVQKGPSSKWVGVSISSNGQHQSCIAEDREIYLSHDWGHSWDNTGPSNAHWSSISVSSSGEHQLASNKGTHVYGSTNFGTDWNVVICNGEWSSVSISSTGMFQSAVEDGGKIHVSSTYGSQGDWTVPSSVSVDNSWTNICISYTGQYQIALNKIDNVIYISKDYGRCWSQLDIAEEKWTSICMSQSGNDITLTTSDGKVYILNIPCFAGMILVPMENNPTQRSIGQIYYNITDNVVKVYDGSYWKTLQYESC